MVFGKRRLKRLVGALKAFGFTSYGVLHDVIVTDIDFCLKSTFSLLGKCGFFTRSRFNELRDKEFSLETAAEYKIDTMHGFRNIFT